MKQIHSYQIITKPAAIFMLLLLLAGSPAMAQSSYIYVSSPYTGQVTYRNTALEVAWYSYGADTVNLLFSLNNGSTWATVLSSYTGTGYTWTTPDTLSESALLKVVSVSDTSVYGMAGPFSIREIPVVTVATPNGGETWNYGETATVSWTGTNLPYYLYVDYSTDGGMTWNALGSGYSDSTGGSAMVYVPFISSETSRVRVYDPYYPDIISDESDQDFTIFTPPVIIYYPLAGDAYYIGEETWISWISTGMNTVNIELSTDGGTAWSMVAQGIDADQGYYAWTVAGVPSASCILRISDAADPSQSGTSGLFTLLATPVITLGAPAGGEILNTNVPFDITWTYDNPESSYLYLEYTTDNGMNWNYIGWVTNPAGNGSFEWTTPVVNSDQCRIRISDYYLGFVSDSSDLFTIITYPETPICMVTVDSASGRNLVVWEKPASSLISSYVVYKESGIAGVYEPIGTVDKDSLSVFADTNSNPSVKSYRYRLGFMDAAGHMFPAGNLHQTIHLSINEGVGNSWNLIWNDYLGFDAGSYNIYRGTTQSDMVMITSISASFTSYTDFGAPAGAVYYMVEVVNPGGCNPSMKSASWSASRSNVATNKVLGMNDNSDRMKIVTFPNPADAVVRVSVTSGNMNGNAVLELRDLVGHRIRSEKVSANQLRQGFDIPAVDLPDGIYFLTVSADGTSHVQKVVVKHK